MQVSEYHPSAGYLIIQHNMQSELQTAMQALPEFFVRSAEYKLRFVGAGFEHNYLALKKHKELFVIRNTSIPESLQPCIAAWRILHDAAKLSLQTIAEKMRWSDELLLNLIDDPNFSAKGVSSSVLRAFRYKGLLDGQAGKASAHHDVGLLTVLPRSSFAALQIVDYTDEGEWLDVEKGCQSNELVVMFGESLALLSNQMIIPATHRVLESETARYSLVYQLRAKPKAVFDSALFENEVVGEFRRPFQMTAQEFVDRERFMRTSVNGLY